MDSRHETCRLPAELLHEIVSDAISACIDEIMGYWWQCIEDSATLELIWTYPRDVPTYHPIYKVSSTNSINGLLATSFQIRHISLRILSDLLDIELDEVGIGR